MLYAAEGMFFSGTDERQSNTKVAQVVMVAISRGIFLYWKRMDFDIGRAESHSRISVWAALSSEHLLGT